MMKFERKCLFRPNWNIGNFAYIPMRYLALEHPDVIAYTSTMSTQIAKRRKEMIAKSNLFSVFTIVLLLLTACGGSAPSVNEDGSINVDVTLTDFKIESSVTAFEAGKTYRFTITNEGLVPHEFVIAEPLMGMEGEAHDDGDDAHSEDEMEMKHEGVVIEVGDDVLQPGVTVTVDATFPEHVDGELEFACHTEGHYEAGMFAPLTME
ncbi:MAG TPA: hypothetical protein VLA72_20315 [Anaerolineales bacterium]|nr:hypothetical protein [Anaerolineales bacterium]